MGGVNCSAHNRAAETVDNSALASVRTEIHCGALPPAELGRAHVRFVHVLRRNELAGHAPAPKGEEWSDGIGPRKFCTRNDGERRVVVVLA